MTSHGKSLHASILQHWAYQQHAQNLPTVENQAALYKGKWIKKTDTWDVLKMGDMQWHPLLQNKLSVPTQYLHSGKNNFKRNI